MIENDCHRADVYECCGCEFAWIGRRGPQGECMECGSEYSKVIEMADVNMTWRDKDGNPRRIRKRADIVDWNLQNEPHRDSGTYWDPDSLEVITFGEWLRVNQAGGAFKDGEAGSAAGQG